MIKAVALLLSLCLLLGCMAFAEGTSFTPGTYEGTGEGFGGRSSIKVKVTVDENTITDVVIEGEAEVPFGQEAFPTFKKSLIGRSDAQIDAVSGATMSRDGVVAAVEQALAAARCLEIAASGGDLTFTGGTYEPTADGYNDPVVVVSPLNTKEFEPIMVTPGSKESPTKIHENTLYQTHGYGRFSIISPVNGKLYFTAHQFYGSDDWFRIIFFSPEGRETERYAYDYKTKSIISHSIEVEANKTYYFYIEGGCTEGGLNDPWYVNSAQFSICFSYFDGIDLKEKHYNPISEDSFIDTPASCTEEGCIKQHCELCDNDYWFKSIPPTGHKPGKWETVYEPTCARTGERELSCENCGEILKTEEMPMTDHVYGEWEVMREATYREPGYRLRVCEICGFVEENEIVLPATDNILEYGDYEFEVEDGSTARLIGYYGYDDRITVPEKVEGLTVTEISSTTFEGVLSLIEIVIPDTVVYIEDGTFGRFNDCTLIVGRGSYARLYAIDHQLRFTYPDANEWLNN